MAGWQDALFMSLSAGAGAALKSGVDMLLQWRKARNEQTKATTEAVVQLRGEDRKDVAFVVEAYRQQYAVLQQDVAAARAEIASLRAENATLRASHEDCEKKQLELELAARRQEVRIGELASQVERQSAQLREALTAVRELRGSGDLPTPTAPTKVPPKG